MANLDAPFGFIPMRHLSGGTIRASDRYRIADAYNTDIFEGDLVATDGAGNVVIASASTLNIGVFKGCWYYESDGTPRFRNRWPADTTVQTGTVVTAVVFDDPNITYRAQASGSVVAADVGLLADIDTATAGSTVTGRSGQAVGAHDASEGNFRILAVLDYARRNAAGNQAKLEAGQDAVVEVQLVEHLYAAAQTTEV
jgi:hypothetical protein